MQPHQTSSNNFEATARDRLNQFLSLEKRSGNDQIVVLTPDASTREYFRIPWKSKTAVAAIYSEPFDPRFHPYVDVTGLFKAAGLPVPDILAMDPEHGIIIVEDLGERQLARVFDSATEDDQELYLERAIVLIAEIQAATARAYDLNSIASRLAFDEAKLISELQFFVEHYFGSLRREELSRAESVELRAELNDIAAELSARPRMLCHRDYHMANLLLDRQDQIRIVDHQDARMGPVSYDLVSLLLDRKSELPSLAEIRAHRLFFLEERRRHGLEALDPDEFASEFRLMTVQRGLKAIGTFSYQTAVCGRGETYERFIRPTFLIALQAIDLLGRFPALRRTIGNRLGNVT